MKETVQDAAYLHDQNYLDLVSYYVGHPIALYTGCGVSWSDDPAFGVGLWDQFVRSILLSDPNVTAQTQQEFDSCLAAWQSEPWEMAEWVAKKIGYEAFEQHAARLVQKDSNFQTKYKLLSGKFLQSARTLNSVAAFCGALAGGKMTKDSQGRPSAVYERAANRRVHAVLTSNYDPFLEAASSTMFRKPILKPVAAHGSSAGSLIEIPVFHIHGYVPFPHRFRKQEDRGRIALVDPVITTSDYETAWKSDDVYNFTMGPQIHILRHFTVLFIGFSFRDRWVRELLMRLNEERKERKDRLYHYAIMKQDEIEAKDRDELVHRLGVRTIPVDRFTQIKDLLSHLYQQALIHDQHGAARIRLPLYEGKRRDEHAKPLSLTPGEYFEALYHCRLSMVRKKKSSTYSRRGS